MSDPDGEAASNVGRVFRLSDGSVVRVFGDAIMPGGMRTLPLGPAHEGMESGAIWMEDVEKYGWEELERTPPVTPMNRVTWSCPRDADRDDDGIFVGASDDWLSITVREEQAVDSYNATVQTSVHLNREAAEELYNAIALALGRPDTPIGS